MYDIAILCGGLAKRLGEITTNTPKSLININGKPFIYHQLKLLEKNNFSHIVLCIGHFGEKIQQYVESLNLNMKIDFSYDGDFLLGTGGAIKKATNLLSESFFVLYGDSYLPTTEIICAFSDNAYWQAMIRLVLIPFLESPPPTENISKTSFLLKRLPINQSKKEKDQPSSFVIAVNSATLSTGE